MTAAQRRNVPLDKVNLRLILVSGNRADFLVSPGDSVTSVVRQVFENWPKEWSSETKVNIPDSLRLIYLGRFLKGSLTLSALNLPLGKTTVMHLIVREHVPGEASSNGTTERSKDRQEGSTCDCCVIL
ncbi:ubiquitin-like protein 3 [Corticium candelabrum]|uniref:ubiquitin-like protein 3 n=1 Tax=Corticium candelabrum TaxID=121492 RepID=UPI002E257676|nr:ubiquitin-like protein 3 [Corticium candelabrum]